MMLSVVTRRFGLNPAHIRLLLLAAFVTVLAGPGRALAEDDSAHVRGIYNLCTSCHGAHGEGNQDIGAPSIAGLPEWYILEQLNKFNNGGRGAESRDLGGMRMRPIGRHLSEASDRQMIAKYVAALPRPALSDRVKGNVVKGDLKFQLCTACHGAKGEGMEATKAPPLANGSDWYYVTQLKNFKNHVRGYDVERDPNGVAMQGIAATLDDDGVNDVVAFINTLKPSNQ